MDLVPIPLLRPDWRLPAKSPLACPTDSDLHKITHTYAQAAQCLKAVEPGDHRGIILLSCGLSLETSTPPDALLRERWEAISSRPSAGEMSCDSLLP